jgi:hypothetical protein
MKSILLATSMLITTTWANALPSTGRLSVESVLDGTTQYRCQLEGGKNQIGVALNYDQRLLSFEVSGDLSFPKGTTLKITGPYTDVDETETSSSGKKSFELSARGYDFSLTFKSGSSLPTLTLIWSGREFFCE